MGGYVSDEEYLNDVVLGAVEAGTLAMIGDAGGTQNVLNTVSVL